MGAREVIIRVLISVLLILIHKAGNCPVSVTLPESISCSGGARKPAADECFGDTNQ